MQAPSPGSSRGSRGTRPLVGRAWRRQGDRRGAGAGLDPEASGRRTAHHRRRDACRSSLPCWRDRSTRGFVAAINAAGGRAVGLTGADAGVGLVKAAPPHRATNGELVDLGLVGEPVRECGGAARRAAVRRKASCRSSPASARRATASLFNVNADTLAGSLAARVGAARLVIAGGTAGVLDGDGGDDRRARRDRHRRAWSVRARRRPAWSPSCARAARRSTAALRDVVIADGREPARLGAAAGRSARAGAARGRASSTTVIDGR